MNKEVKFTHTLKILLAILATVIVLGGGFLGWLYYVNSLSQKQSNIVKTAPTKQVDTVQAEADDIKNEIQKSDDIDISDLDNTSELDKIDISGL